MSLPPSPPRVPAPAPERTDPGTGVVPRLTTILRDPAERRLLTMALSVPASALMAIWKLALLLVAPSLLVLSAGVFAIGVTASKYHAARSHPRLADRSPRDAPSPAGGPAAPRTTRTQVRSYRVAGAIVLGVSVLYVLACLPALLRATGGERYPEPVAIGIATVAFAELATSICGAVTARRIGDLAIEAVRLTNLANALVLLVLTQNALLSMVGGSGATNTYGGVSGAVLGTGAALIGGYMVVRPLPAASADAVVPGASPVPTP